MTDRDLTPAEARAEVEAFMGEWWTVVHESWPRAYRMSARRGVRIEVESGYAPTTRAAVAALKQAWSDAVRPWMEAAIEAKLDTADVDGYAPTERVIDRVCEKGMSNG